MYPMGSQQSRMAPMAGSSKRNIQIPDSTALTANCIQDSLTPSVLGLKWSMIRMWTAKAKALMNTSRSPVPTVKASVTHSRYRPAAANSTPSQTFQPTLRWKKIPMQGTSTMYSAVIKPVLPAEV